MTKLGIEHQMTGGYAPEQNGKAERQNRTIVEKVRTMIHARSVPKHLWAEAVNTAVYILNRVTGPQGATATSYELWMGRKPTVEHVRVFGSQAFVHVPAVKRKKLDDKAVKGILVGYQVDSGNYRVYMSKTQNVIESHDVMFSRFSERGGQSQADGKVCVQIDDPLKEMEENDVEDITAGQTSDTGADRSTAGDDKLGQAVAGETVCAEGGQGIEAEENSQADLQQESEQNQELLERLSSICDDMDESNADELAEEFMDAIQSPEVRRSNRERKPPSWHRVRDG